MKEEVLKLRPGCLRDSDPEEPADDDSMVSSDARSTDHRKDSDFKSKSRKSGKSKSGKKHKKDKKLKKKKSKDCQQGDGTYVCDFIFNSEQHDEFQCCKIFDHKGDFKKHYKKHFKEKDIKKFKCNVEMGTDEHGKVLRCVREFKQKYNLRDHQKKGTNHSSTIKDPRVKNFDQDLVCKFEIG